MPTTRANAASEAAKGGEFHASVRPSEPLENSGHAMGTQVGNAAVPEFHAEVHPAGTAPKEHTFQPNAESEVPGQALNENASERTGALDMPGATSQSVHTGLGKPVAGQPDATSHGHSNSSKRNATGLAGVGASTGDDTGRQKGADLPEGVEKGTRGKGSDNYPGATERVPESAESVAAERA